MANYPSLAALIENLLHPGCQGSIGDYFEDNCSNVERKLSLKWSKGVTKKNLFFSPKFPKEQAIFLGKMYFKCRLFGKTPRVTVGLFLGNSTPPWLLPLGLGRDLSQVVTTDQNRQVKPTDGPWLSHMDLKEAL